METQGPSGSKWKRVAPYVAFLDQSRGLTGQCSPVVHLHYILMPCPEPPTYPLHGLSVPWKPLPATVASPACLLGDPGACVGHCRSVPELLLCAVPCCLSCANMVLTSCVFTVQSHRGQGFASSIPPAPWQARLQLWLVAALGWSGRAFSFAVSHTENRPLWGRFCAGVCACWLLDGM